MGQDKAHDLSISRENRWHGVSNTPGGIFKNNRISLIQSFNNPNNKKQSSEVLEEGSRYKSTKRHRGSGMGGMFLNN